MNDIIQQLAPYLVSIVIGGLTYLITYLKTKTIKLKIETLEKLFKDSDEEYIIADYLVRYKYLSEKYVMDDRVLILHHKYVVFIK